MTFVHCHWEIAILLCEASIIRIVSCCPVFVIAFNDQEVCLDAKCLGAHEIHLLLFEVCSSNIQLKVLTYLEVNNYKWPRGLSSRRSRYLCCEAL